MAGACMSGVAAWLCDGSKCSEHQPVAEHGAADRVSESFDPGYIINQHGMMPKKNHVQFYQNLSS